MILMVSVHLAAMVRAYLDGYAPTNLFFGTLRDPGAQRFAFPASGVMAVGHGLLGAWLPTIIDSSGLAWLNPLALLCAWNTIKFSLCVALGLSRRFTSPRGVRWLAIGHPQPYS